MTANDLTETKRGARGFGSTDNKEVDAVATKILKLENIDNKIISYIPGSHSGCDNDDASESICDCGWECECESGCGYECECACECGGCENYSRLV